MQNTGSGSSLPKKPKPRKIKNSISWNTWMIKFFVRS